MEKLAVIVPVYNEEAIIEFVVKEWLNTLNKLNIEYQIFVYNDGSTDNTGNILELIAKENDKLIVIHQKNKWHGPTILNGYKEHCKNFDWIFQIDADNEMSPQGFEQLWENRQNNDLLMIIRNKRKQTEIRKVISWASRMCIRIFYGKGPWDVNSPYRLMKSKQFTEFFNKIPPNTLSPNMILSGIAAKRKMKIYQIPILCEERKTGKAINGIKLLKTAIKSFWQTVMFSINNK